MRDAIAQTGWQDSYVAGDHEEVSNCLCSPREGQVCPRPTVLSPTPQPSFHRCRHVSSETSIQVCNPPVWPIDTHSPKSRLRERTTSRLCRMVRCKEKCCPGDK